MRRLQARRGRPAELRLHPQVRAGRQPGRLPGRLQGQGVQQDADRLQDRPHGEPRHADAVRPPTRHLLYEERDTKQS